MKYKHPGGLRNRVRQIKISYKITFLLLGFASTAWFLIRVIPKPSRATYPCMRAAAPIMSSFIIYLLGLGTSVLAFKKFTGHMQKSKYWKASLFLLLSILVFGITSQANLKESIGGIFSATDTTFPVESNQPIGLAQGMNPGRVVWIHNNEATNENYVPLDNSTDLWYSNDNTNELAIKEMLELSITRYAGMETLTDAWNAIFKAYNQTHGKGNVGYVPGEKIAFKINLTNQSCRDRERPRRMDATPQLLNAMLGQLVNVVGVAQEDITMGDPYREFRAEYRDLVMSQYPDVYYVDGAGDHGVHQTVPSTEEVLVFSDGKLKSTLPRQYLDAAYVINIACLKSHNGGGITLLAKNHQGSFLEKGDSPQSQSAEAMHYSLPYMSAGTGRYRHTVDYLGHEETGGKGLIYVVDGIWGGEDWQGWIQKFKSDPFNDDYPNSIFLAQDPVALESVCFDVLFNEYVTDPAKTDFPIRYKNEIADHLSQCASSEYWPAGIIYDPEGDGTPIGSLGVFEHWNNPADRQYSRNLDPENGNGIELITGNSDIVNYCDSSNISIIHTVLDESCQGANDGSIEIEVDGNYPGFIFEWSNGSASKDLKDLVPDTYLVKIVDSKGCSKSETISVAAAKPLEIEEIVGATEADDLQIYSYSVSNEEMFDYHWAVAGGNIVSGQGTNGIEIQWGSGPEGMVSACFESDKGCHSDTVYMTVSIQTSGMDNFDPPAFSLYPNPARDILNVECKQQGPYSISLYSTNGVLLHEIKGEQGSTQLDLSQFQKGVYVLALRSEDLFMVRKLVLADSVF